MNLTDLTMRTWQCCWWPRSGCWPVTCRRTRRRDVLPSPGRNGAQSSPGHLSTIVSVGSIMVTAPPQVREAGHVCPRCPVVSVRVTNEWPGMVLRPAPQPHLLLILQPALDCAHVGEEREGQVSTPLPTLRPRLCPATSIDCLEETSVLQWNWKQSIKKRSVFVHILLNFLVNGPRW